jgi:hypothetical protein
MESIITAHHDASPHLNAVLKRFALWGMLDYYDMDKVWETLHNASFSFFFVFYNDTMDHRALVQFLKELREYEPDPLRGLASISFFYPKSNRLYDINALEETLRTQPIP